MPDPGDFDLDFRPATFFVFANARRKVRATVDGQARRDLALGLAQAADDDALRAHEFLTKPRLSEQERAAWGAIHPALMGGEYLPARRRLEVEIARVVLASTTGDVIAVRARWSGGRIRYRVVDEYPENGGYTLGRKSSMKPLTMGQLIGLLDTARGPDHTGVVTGLLDFLLEVSCDLDDLRDFVTVESDLYPELGRWYREVVEEWYEAKLDALGCCDPDDDPDDE